MIFEGIEEEVAEEGSNGAWGMGADGSMVAGFDGRDFCCGSCEEGFIGVIYGVPCEECLLSGDIEMLGQLNDGVSGDAVESGDERRGD